MVASSSQRVNGLTSATSARRKILFLSNGVRGYMIWKEPAIRIIFAAVNSRGDSGALK